jgi:DmsE family decaheme c-type cytochrome
MKTSGAPLMMALAVLFPVAVVCLAAVAQPAGSGAPPACLDCHGPSPQGATLAIAHTEHASLGADNSGCESCHGPSTAHRESPIDAQPELSFAAGTGAEVSPDVDSCQDCHAEDDTPHWVGSVHAAEGLSCSSCHQIHARPGVLDLGRLSREPSCLGCHGELRSALRMQSRHPILEGKTGCSDCHDPHGGGGEYALRELSVNDNCTRCHSELRGPFLWEHQPVTEDCSLCHRAHGSIHDRLLTVRGPALCQQCHSAAFHPSQPYGGDLLPGRPAAVNVAGKNCLNCHGQVHGSNHPSGARLTR